jgi:hypothetical protein
MNCPTTTLHLGGLISRFSHAKPASMIEPALEAEAHKESSSRSPRNASDAINNLPSDKFLDIELCNASAIPPDGRIGLAFTRESLNQATDWKQKVEEIEILRRSSEKLEALSQLGIIR